MRGRMILRGLFLAVAVLLQPAPIVADDVQLLRAGELLRGSFVQERFLEGFNAPLRSEGSFVLAPELGLIWRAEKPFAITTAMTPQGLAQQSEGVTTLNLPASHAPFMASLYGMLSGALTGDWHNLERDFGVTRSDAAGKWTLQLIPRNNAGKEAMPIARINISGGSFVEQVEIQKQGGDRDKLTFFDQKRFAEPLGAEEQRLLQGTGQP